MNDLLIALAGYQISVGEFLQQTIRAAVGALMGTKLDGLGISMRALIASCLTFSLVVYGVRTMAGDIASNGKQVLVTCLFVVIGLSITGTTFYEEYITHSIYVVKDNVSSFLMVGNSDENIYAAFSEVNGRMFAHADKVLESAGMTDVGMWIHALSIMIIYGLYYCVFVAVTLFCELALAVLLVLGILIIPISAFATARELGKSWCKAIAKYMMVFIIISIIVSILNIIGDFLITEYMNATYSPDSSSSGDLNESKVNMNNPIFGGILLIGAFGFYLMLQAMELAAEITGGVMSDGAAGMKSVQSAAASTTNTTSSSIKNLKKMGSGGIDALKGLKK